MKRYRSHADAELGGGLIVMALGEQHQLHELRVTHFRRPHTFDARHGRLTDIDQHDLRWERQRMAERFFHGSETTDTLEAFGAVKQRHQTFANLALVFSMIATRIIVGAGGIGNSLSSRA